MIAAVTSNATVSDQMSIRAAASSTVAPISHEIRSSTMRFT
ncbi:Uncharacterised protein [Mycobacteroides abscessus subsp. abscessus]|nr:Uncharacterised protein [Mycobacteroides abscessus subsp. abscessus]